MTTTRHAFVLITAAGALTLASCAASNLESEDPAGHQACTEYMVTAYNDATEDDTLAVALGGNSIAAEHALKSTTPEIRAAAEDTSHPDFGLYLADGDALVAACMEHGYEVAEKSPAWWKLQGI